MLHALALTLPSPSSPEIFSAGPFTLRYYGLCIALGIAVATWLTARELKRKGYDSVLALDALFFIVPPGFVGARLYHVLTDYQLYANDPFPGVFEVWNGGLGIYGAVIGGFLGLLLFARVRGISALAFADAAAPGVVLAQAIGRWGNYFNQELFGRPSDLPWALEISPQNRPPGFTDVPTFHPTFLYESIWNVLVCLTLLFVARRFANSLKNGDILLLYVCLYSVGRFFVETLRIDPAFLIGDFRGNLFVASILALTFALILFLRHAGTGRSPRKRPAGD
ncbi:MAG: Prolipoprotein diacylglyceryl transferase [uncultured Rubrobacteraceae bacterium]|uniref:Phosphatidylglycerol--prolipoprotein diacylglyceryl transferase n=1 Tax=uncultured Rubrobacteraceae bacterium TaxID=349277 RepID=A0A6J4QLA1_9ACTN|nr:MAG: Prolipoprotein diacylglyceryl transferase [uncultured Rubrobacteraceae bacterium]